MQERDFSCSLWYAEIKKLDAYVHLLGNVAFHMNKECNKSFTIPLSNEITKMLK